VSSAVDGGKQGSGTLATLSLKPLTTGAFTLTFNTGTLAATIESGQNNALKTANPIILTPSSPTPTPTPTPTPQPSADPPRVDGDLNSDGHVNIFDYNLLVSKFGNPYTIFDYNSLVANFGK